MSGPLGVILYSVSAAAPPRWHIAFYLGGGGGKQGMEEMRLEPGLEEMLGAGLRWWPRGTLPVPLWQRFWFSLLLGGNSLS